MKVGASSIYIYIFLKVHTCCSSCTIIFKAAKTYLQSHTVVSKAAQGVSNATRSFLWLHGHCTVVWGCTMNDDEVTIMSRLIFHERTTKMGRIASRFNEG